MRSSDPLRRLFALVAVWLLVSASGVASAQDDDEDLFGDDEDFYEDLVLEDEEETPVEPVSPWLYWGVEVPVDVLVLRPYAAVDVAVGSAFFSLIAPVQALGSLAGYWLTFDGEERYMDTGNLEQAFQQTVLDPLDYLVDRPLGEFSAE